jgi:L-rhamnose mutarotase
VLEDSRTGNATVKRVGIVVGLRPEKRALYEQVHAADHPGVRHLLTKYHIHNFSIFLRPFPNGALYLFGYYEYVGTDYDADMRRLAAEPENQAWLVLCDPCQLPLPGEETWATMESVYFHP